jgi:hypothetical protein
MTPAVIADSIVNICGAVGLSVAMMTFHRRDSKSPLTKRLLLAIGVVTMLFFVRGVAWWSGNALLDRMSLIPAALIPFGILIVTEGMLRRHAPRLMKMAVAVGGYFWGSAACLAWSVSPRHISWCFRSSSLPVSHPARCC